MSTNKWDAKDYQDNSSAQQKWARELIGKLDLKGEEKTLDIGCGDGKVTAEIAEILTSGSIIGIDISKEMIELANNNFPHKTHKNLQFKQCDTSKLNFEAEFDIIFSNATLHWVKDHKPVLKGISRALKNNGKALLQMGGKGNAKDIVEVVNVIRNKTEWKKYFIGFEFTYSFYGSGKYKKLLHYAGLTDDNVKLIKKDMTHKGVEGLKGWFRTTWFPYTDKIPEKLRTLFIDEVVNKYIEKYPIDEGGLTHLEMIRLEVMTRKS